MDEGSLGGAAEPRLGEAVDLRKPGCRPHSCSFDSLWVDSNLKELCVDARQAAGPSSGLCHGCYVADSEAAPFALEMRAQVTVRFMSRGRASQVSTGPLASLRGTLPGELAGLDEVACCRILDREFRRILDILADGHSEFWHSEIGKK